MMRAPTHGDELVRSLERDLERAADPFRGASVVVVDDEASNVLLLERMLRLAGVSEVHGVTDARRAVEMCRAVAPDLLVLDLHMPAVDGFAVLAELRRSLPDDEYLPVLVLSGDTSAEARERALDAGAKDFVVKPFDRVEVLLRVRNLLETRALYQGVRRQNVLLRQELAAQAEERREREAELARRRAAIEAVLATPGALGFVYQPIVDLEAGSTVAVEALARFRSPPERSPDKWFGDAAEVGLGAELELAAVRGALGRLDDLPPGVRMSVNVSPHTVVTDDLPELLEGRAGDRVVVELTEHDRVTDTDGLRRAIETLRGLGALIAVDDAGAGWSGLRRILGLRPDIIKLDLELTRGVDRDPVRRALAAALVSFAADTAATLVAEGIETAEELRTLKELGVGWGQGYHLGRPGELEQVLG